MIDSKGYRLNVGIVITNNNKQLFWGKRFKQHSWQFPQGGINDNEKTIDTLYRELYEEVGLKESNVKIIKESTKWYKYNIPVTNNPKYVEKCIGQKQKWFLLKLVDDDDSINLNASVTPEFDDWQWVSYWYPLRQIVYFKKNVYKKVLNEFVKNIK